MGYHLFNTAGHLLAAVGAGFRSRRTLAFAVCLSALNQGIVIGTGFLIGYAIPGFGPVWLSYFVVIPLTFVAVLLPSVGGYGVREASYATFFGWFGISTDIAAVYSILLLTFIWVNALVGATLFISTSYRRRRDAVREPPESGTERTEYR